MFASPNLTLISTKTETTEGHYAASEAPTEAPSYPQMQGLPVSIDLMQGSPYGCADWSSGRLEPFSEVRVVETGKSLTYRARRDLITACRTGW